MRNLKINRIRALATFSLSYACILDGNIADFEEHVEMEEFWEKAEADNAVVLRNGQSKTISISEDAHTLFMVIWTPNKNRFASQIQIPAGTEDVEIDVFTEYNGYNVLEYALREHVEE